MHSKITKDSAGEFNYGITGLLNEILFGSRLETISLILNTMIRTCQRVLFPSCCIKYKTPLQMLLKFCYEANVLWTKHPPLTVII